MYNISVKTRNLALNFNACYVNVTYGNKSIYVRAINVHGICFEVKVRDTEHMRYLINEKPGLSTQIKLYGEDVIDCYQIRK